MSGAERVRADDTDPEPLRRPRPPSARYPVNALGRTLAQAANALHAVMRAPLALCGQSVLAAASVAAQAHADVAIHGRRHPLTLWNITVAESGERKSAVDRVALAAHEEHQRGAIDEANRAAADHELAMLAHADALAAARRSSPKGASLETIRDLLRACGPAPTPPPSGILLCAEPTLEALQKIYLSGVPSLGLFSDEGAVFFGGHAMQKEHAMRSVAAMSKLWDDGTSDRVRAGDGAHKLFGRRLALHLMMQPVVAERVLSDELLIGQGFLARTLIAWPDSTAGTRLYRQADVMQDSAVQTYHARMRALLARRPTTRDSARGELAPRSLELSETALAGWMDAYDTFERRIGPGREFSSPIIRPWASKAAEQVLRIAGVITLTENLDATEIDGSEIDAAAELVEFYMGEVLRLVDNAAVPVEVRHAEAVLEWCRDKGHALVSSRQLLQLGPNAVRTGEALSAAMAVLERAGHAKKANDVVIDGRRPKRAWRIAGVATPATPATDRAR